MTIPSGLQLLLDGQPVGTAPYSFLGVVRIARTLEAADQSSDGTGYAFAGWTDGAAARRTVLTPFADTTYTAVFAATAVTALPAAPDGLALVANGLTLHVSWNRSSGATSYRLEAGSAAGLADLFNADVGNAASLQGLVPPGRYVVRVRAVNQVGTSPPSAEVSVAVSGASACATPPPAPSGYTAQADGLRAAFAWSASPAATSYLLEAGLRSGAADLLTYNVGDTTTFAATAGPGTYVTRLRAVNACGASAPSGDLPVTLACTPQSALPRGLMVVKAGGTALFTWGPSLAATGYRLRAGTSPGASDVADIDLGGASTLAVSLTGVPPGLYYIRVAAVSACGVSAPSNEVALSVP